jgi:molecular chaperone DnaJ
VALKNYYVILGIPRNESVAGVHEAFRVLAKRYHPDVAGPESAEHFRNLVEAYEHLSDAQLRAKHNHSLQESEQTEFSTATPFVSRGTQRPEPLVPQALSILRTFEKFRPSYDEVIDRFVRNFTGIGIPKSERIEDLNLEVILSPEEAAQGGVVPISVPTFHPCPLCRGSGRDWLFPCSYCLGEGMIEEEQSIGVKIPPLVRDRTIFEVPISGLGIHNFHIRLHFRIAA